MNLSVKCPSFKINLSGGVIICPKKQRLPRPDKRRQKVITDN